MKIKVNKALLIAALNTKKQQEIGRFSSEQLSFSAKEQEARARYIENLKAYTEEVSNGGEILFDSYALKERLKEGVNFPRELKEPELAKYDSLLDRLALVEDETIEMTEKDKYLELI